MISTAIKRAFTKGRSRGWDRIYVAVDIHDTMVGANYSKEIPTEFYDNAKRILQYLTKRRDVVLLLFTCSHPPEIEKYLKFFEGEGIIFKYANENPDVKTDTHGYGNYDKKMYFDVILEDKGGFEPESDWIVVEETFLQEPLLES